MKTAELTYPDTGGIKQSDLSLMFQIFKRVNNGIDLLFVRNTGKQLVIMEVRNLITIPVAMEYILIKIPKLGDMDIDGSWIQIAHIFKVTDIGPELFPGNIRKRF